MMQSLVLSLQKFAIMFLGLSGGIVVGASFVALLVIFDLIPRLAQLSKSYHLSKKFELALISGALFFTVADILDVYLPLPSIIAQMIAGWFNGMFVGMLAAALTEVLNVLPIIAKRLNLTNAIISLMMAMVFGKTVASLFDWIIFQR